MLTKGVAYQVDVNDTNDVQVLPLGSSAATTSSQDIPVFDANTFPLFTVALTVRDNRVAFKRDPAHFVEAPIAQIEKAVTTLQVVHMQRVYR